MLIFIASKTWSGFALLEISERTVLLTQSVI